jgi:asparagine synthase (glutamine-hydrolysing)
MCGLTGALSFKDESFKITEQYITKMRDTMIHRGPDGSGTWVDSNGRVGLGHRRLSIIDLSDNAAQPMSNNDGSIQLVYNGEIYNHSEIKDELKNCGRHLWKTDHSDTEVVLQAFEEWGIDAIHKFRGMFAFAVWDAKNNELWLVRDRIGIKPLYYSIHNNRIVFASEIKALLEDPDQKREVNEEAFFHYLSFIFSPAPNTLFAGINKIPPGTWLRVSETGQVREHRYWDVWDHTSSLENSSEDEISEQLIAELRTAVNYRKIGDVPVGVFLSGGIDSSTNAALFSENETAPVKTFSIGFEGNYNSYKNELHYAKRMAQNVNADYHEQKLTQKDLIDFIPKMIQLQDEPIADIVCMPVYFVSKLARENGVTVCQVGEGADELFCGYPFWQYMFNLQKLGDLPVPRLLKSTGLGTLNFLGMDHTAQYEHLRRNVNGQPIWWSGSDSFTHENKLKILSPRLRSKFKNFTSWEALQHSWKRFNDNAWDKSTLNWMSYVDLNHRLPELLLMRVDKMSMGVSLECRVPFLDHKFVELAMSIPPSLKLKNGNLKSILKKSVRGIIPDEFIDRKKQGFGVPIQEWVAEEMSNQTQKTLREFCANTDFLDYNEVSKCLEHNQGPAVWQLLNFAHWWNEFIK